MLRFSKSIGRSRANGLKLYQGRFRLDIGENFYTEMDWHRLPRAVVNLPSLEGFKSHVDEALGDMDSGNLGSAGLVGLNDLSGLFQPKPSCDFVFPLLLVCLPPMKSFLQIKPKDHHYKLIFLLNGKGASYFGRDRNKTLLCKPNIHLSSALLALTAELFVVSACFLPAEMDVSIEIPLVWDTLPAVPRARCLRRWKTPSRARPGFQYCTGRCIFSSPKSKSSIS